ncbi:MAG: hypothetical protein ACE5MG_10785, partial [Candidatus Methylomirabilales bacterium]
SSPASTRRSTAAPGAAPGGPASQRGTPLRVFDGGLAAGSDKGMIPEPQPSRPPPGVRRVGDEERRSRI